MVLLGTFGILYAFGYSINVLTLFAMVLSIGLLVDDAIVVVENVERLLEENPDVTPLETTRESMREISKVVIGIALILSAVFFTDGILWQLNWGDLSPVLSDAYQQYGTICLSCVNFHPALCDYPQTH